VGNLSYLVQQTGDRVTQPRLCFCTKCNRPSQGPA